MSVFRLSAVSCLRGKAKLAKLLIPPMLKTNEHYAGTWESNGMLKCSEGFDLNALDTCSQSLIIEVNSLCSGFVPAVRFSCTYRFSEQSLKVCRAKAGQHCKRMSQTQTTSRAWDVEVELRHFVRSKHSLENSSGRAPSRMSWRPDRVQNLS